jgi:hypothetical protein
MAASHENKIGQYYLKRLDINTLENLVNQICPACKNYVQKLDYVYLVCSEYLKVYRKWKGDLEKINKAKLEMSALNSRYENHRAKTAMVLRSYLAVAKKAAKISHTRAIAYCAGALKTIESSPVKRNKELNQLHTLTRWLHINGPNLDED